MCNATGKVSRNIYFIAALLSAVVDSFSSAQGLITWITGMVIFFAVFCRKVFSSPYFITWTLVAVAVWIVYFHNYGTLEHYHSFAYLVEHPGELLLFFFSITGNVICGKAGSFEISIVFALLILLFLFIACVKIWRDKQVRQFIFPLALALNSLFTLGSITAGRVVLFDADQAFASRYTTFSICLLVAVALLWMELKDKDKNKVIIKNFTRVLEVILLLSIPVAMIGGTRSGKIVNAYRDYNAYILETINMQPDQFIRHLSPWYDLVRDHAAYLQQRQLNVFHRPRYAVPELLFRDSLATFNNEVLQFPQNTLLLTPDYVAVMRPAVHPKYRSEVEALYIDIDGQVFPLYYKSEFNDSPASPYNLSAISSQILSKGIHTVKFKALQHNNAGYYVINPDWSFEVR
jgi:hypothetical protein